MNIQTIYIAGPITGKPDGNRKAFARAEQDLTLMGYRAVNPHKLDHSRAGGHWHLNRRVCIAAMMTCDAIVLLEGWEESDGAKMEIKLATSLAMPWAFMDSKLEFHQYSLTHGQR
jgi:hypothetical protein